MEAREAAVGGDHGLDAPVARKGRSGDHRCVGRVAVGVGVLLVVAGLALGTMRVGALEADELEHVSEPVTLSPVDGPHGPEPHRELARARVDAGEDVRFEICAPEPFSEAWVSALEIVVWDPGSEELVMRTEIDAERVGAAYPVGAGECIVVAQGRELPAGGELAVEAVWEGRTMPPAVARVPIRARVVAHRPLAPDDPWAVLAVLAGAVLAVVGAAGWRRRRASLDGSLDEAPSAGVVATSPSSGTRRDAAVRVAAGLVLLGAATIATGLVPFFGAVAGLGRGLFLAIVQIAAALVLVRGKPASAELHPRAAALGLAAPSRGWWLLAAPPIGIALWLLSGFLLRFVPSTGEAAIEAFVAWPSGLLAVALVAVIVPLAEELFFRGFVYGTLDARFGARTAFVATVLLFAVAHLPQVWHAWGALASILVTGIALTALRARTGSVLVPALAHLAYNGINAVLGLASG